MEKKLGKNLGLFSVISIATGTMLGAGFIMPGLAVNETGASAILSFMIAGLIALIAALSVSELATAMPKSGGSYYFITRAMGKMPGSIDGWGAWFTLIFKGAFAILGFSFYISLFTSSFLPDNELVQRGIGFVFLLLLLGLNLIGTKKVGFLQKIMLLGSVVILLVLIGFGLGKSQGDGLEDPFPKGYGTVITTSSLIFVSYIGVVKVAAVAAEIKNPKRNIPLGILLSCLIAIVLYCFIVFILSDHIFPGEVAKGEEYTILAKVGKELLGGSGYWLLAAAGALACAAMANASVIAASRYPFAMSSDKMVPAFLGKINKRFRTPYLSILVSCLILGLVILFFDISSIVKIASAFNIVVFIMLNLAVIILRHSKPKWYRPPFKAPGYPIIQILGIGGCIGMLLGYPFWVIAGTGGFLVLGVGWYHFYAKKRATVRGAVCDVALKSMKKRANKKTKIAIEEHKREKILLVITNPDHEDHMLNLASELFEENTGEMVFARLKTFPSQTPLFVRKEFFDEKDMEFENKVEEHAKRLGLWIKPIEIITHSIEDCTVQLIEETEADLLMIDWDQDLSPYLLKESYIDHLFHTAPCDILVFKDKGLTDVKNIMVPATTEEPLDDHLLGMISSLVHKTHCNITLLRVLKPNTSSEKIRIIRKYMEKVTNYLSVPANVEILDHGVVERAIIERSDKFDLLVLGVTRERIFKEIILGSVADHVAAWSKCSVLIFHRSERSRKKMVDHVIERIAD